MCLSVVDVKILLFGKHIIRSAKMDHAKEQEVEVETFKSDATNSSENEKRGQWGQKLDYLLSMIGYSVGLGNIWRFPYVCLRNGGGAFLIPFIFFLLASGLPLYFLEVSIGQFTGQGPLGVWGVCPIFQGIGVGMIVSIFLTLLYYNMITTWILYYMGSAFFNPLPWTRCDGDWNTEACLAHQSSGNHLHYANSSLQLINSSIMQLNTTKNNDMSIRNITSITPQEEFWLNKVLHVSEGLHDIGGFSWQTVFIFFIAWIVVFLCLIKGVKSVGKVVYITATLPYIFLSILLIRGLTLPGSADGIVMYLKPDFKKLGNVQVWMEAGLQVFYSLGPAWGPLITMASFNKFNNNCYRDAVILTLISEGTSIFAGFVVFSTVGFMAKRTNKPIESLVKSGPGLAFLAYPEALAQLPLPNVWAVLFFVMLFIVGLDTQFGSMETCVTAITDSFPRLRKWRTLVTGLMCLCFFIVGLPLCSHGGIYMFQLFDWYIAALAVPVFAICECIIFGWIYGAETLSRDIECMIGRTVPVYMRILWCFITPGLLLVLTVFTFWTYTPPKVGHYTYPVYGRAFGWLIASLPLIPFPIYARKAYKNAYGCSTYEKLKNSFKPHRDWKRVSTVEREKYAKSNKDIHGLKDRIIFNICGK